MTKNLMEFATEYSGAWAAHDPDSIAAMHTEDSVFELHELSAPAAGRAAVRDLIATLVTAVPDLRFEHKRAHFGDAHFVSEYVMKGTAEGKPFTIAGVDVFTMRDGLVAREGQLFGLAGIPTSGRRRPRGNIQRPRRLKCVALARSTLRDTVASIGAGSLDT